MAHFKKVVHRLFRAELQCFNGIFPVSFHLFSIFSTISKKIINNVYLPLAAEKTKKRIKKPEMAHFQVSKYVHIKNASVHTCIF